jgi:dsRNA-specific ribonuclease
LEPFITLEKLGENPVVTLLEICQKNGLKFRIDTDSWENDQTAKVYIGDSLIGKAAYGKKDIAMNRAAKDALDKIESYFDCETMMSSMQVKEDPKSSIQVLCEEKNNEDERDKCPQ